METTPKTMSQIDLELQEIHNKKVALLDKHGMFDGGEAVNQQFDALNKQEDELINQQKAIEFVITDDYSAIKAEVYRIGLNRKRIDQPWKKPWKR